MKIKRYALIIREGDEERTVLIGTLAAVFKRAEELLFYGNVVGIRPCWL